MLPAMSRLAIAAAGLALAIAVPAAAQPVEVAPLPAPDAFSTPGRETGLPPDLWRGASVETARTVLPLIEAKPLSPAAAQLAWRVLATGARGPLGSTDDEALAGGRVSALIALGDPAAAARILARTPGVERSPALDRAAAESALLAGDDARACAAAERLAVGRGETYWLKLRAYCQARAGETAQAQLTFELAQAQAKDPIYARLMAAKLSGAAAGAASLRDGLDYALSRDLGLDLAAAKPAPAVAAALAGGREPAPPEWSLASLDGDLGGLAGAAATGQPLPSGGVTALIAAAAEAEAKTRGRLQSAALLIAALSPELSPSDRARLATFAVPEGKTPAGRNLAMADAAERRLPGETALLALWTASESGAAGPGVADRARIVRALAQAGLDEDARAFAVEGLTGLK